MTSENPNAPGEHPDKSVNPKNDSSKKDQHARIKPPVSPKVIPAPKNRNEPCQCRYEPTPRWWRIVEGVGVAAVVFYAVVTYFMWRDSHHNFVIDERAWLTFPTFSFPDAKEGSPIRGAVQISNIGKTIAKTVQYQFSMGIIHNNEFPKLDYSGLNTAGFSGMMAPGVSTAVFVGRYVNEFTFSTFTQSDFEDLQSGRTFVIIYGRGRYVDIFGETHWYQVCNWHSYYGGTQSYNSTPCVAYSNTGDRDGPFQ